MSFQDRVSKWEKQIREGQGRAVAEELQALRTEEVPAALRPLAAGLARRTGVYKTGLDFLREDYFKYRDTYRGDQAAVMQEAVMTEYAALLTEIGATQISERILAHYEKPNLPATYFYRALLSLKNWDHEKAVADLRSFRALLDEPYWQAIADLNLAGSLIYLKQTEEAAALLSGLEERQSALSPMAKGVLAELRGEFLFFSGSPDLARAHFAESFRNLKETNNPSRLFAEKWILISDLTTRPWDEVEQRYREFQGRARELGFWEILRELDRYFGMQFNDEKVLNKLYFGSPASGYRKLICRDAKWQPPSEYFHQLGPADEPSAFFDMQKLEMRSAAGKFLRIPQNNLRLLKSLAGDLYKPKAVGSLFEQIYHGQHFDPSFAGQRVHQAISRFRKFVAKSGLPLDVRSSDLGFTLVSEGSFAVRYTAAAESAAPASLELANVLRLKETFGDEGFSAAQMAERMGLSRRSVNRILSTHLESGEILRFGAGSNTRYRLKAA